MRQNARDSRRIETTRGKRDRLMRHGRYRISVYSRDNEDAEKEIGYKSGIQMLREFKVLKQEYNTNINQDF